MFSKKSRRNLLDLSTTPFQKRTNQDLNPDWSVEGARGLEDWVRKGGRDREKKKKLGKCVGNRQEDRSLKSSLKAKSKRKIRRRRRCRRSIKTYLLPMAR
jgi:hypothetical protein